MIVGLLAYSCSSPSPVTNPKASSSSTPRPSTSQSRLITPGPQVSGSVAPPNNYPTTGPTGSSNPSSGASGGAGGTAGGSGGNGGGGGNGTLSGAGSGCVLSVSVTTDKTAANGVPQYSSGADPTVNVKLQNTGTANCLIPADGIVVTVTEIGPTGSQQIVWNSSACQSTSGSEMAIGPNNPVKVPIPWQRIDNVTSCPGTTAAANDQLYEATASALGVTSSPAQFELD